MKAPTIIVQFYHLYGPLKDKLQEFSESTILIGRHPSCDILFPKDVAIVSRKHAQIIREGNRFKLIDKSSNGTFVNGKKVQETYLKDGDVLIFAEGGPKVSFLTKIVECQNEIESISLPNSLEKSKPKISEVEKSPVAVQSKSDIIEEKKITVQQVQVPLTIQYGPAIHSFKKLPIIIGKNPDCNLPIDHPEILDHHAQIFFSQNQYWVKDLTGQMLISINEHVIDSQSSLTSESLVSLTPRGPIFRFLDGGRLAEVELLDPEEFADTSCEEEICSSDNHSDGYVNRAKSIIKKIFRT